MKPILLLTLTILLLASNLNAAPISCLGPPAAGSNVLSLNPMGCALGGLTFDMFTVTSAPPGTTVFLSALGTRVVGSEVDLGFQITTPTPPVDTILIYRVTGSGIIGVDNQHNGLNTTIGEVVCAVALVGGQCPADSVLANFSNTGGRVDSTFPPQSQIFIMKDISEPSANSFISSFVNSQSIPEPISSGLIGSGLLALGLLGRRSRKK